MIIVGWILIALGVILTIHGIQLNHSIEAQLTAMFLDGNINPGTVWIWVGIISAAVGIFFLFRFHSKDSFVNPFEGIKIPDRCRPRKTTKCANCGKEIPSGALFCPGCGHPVKHEDNSSSQGASGNGWHVPTDLDR